MALSPEKAMEAAKKKAAPVIKAIGSMIDDVLGGGDFDGISPISVKIPRQITVGKASTPSDVHRFMVDEAVDAYRKPSESGSCWNVRVDAVDRPAITASNIDVIHDLCTLTFTPIFPPSPGPGDYTTR